MKEERESELVRGALLTLYIRSLSQGVTVLAEIATLALEIARG